MHALLWVVMALAIVLPVSSAVFVLAGAFGFLP